MRYQDQIIGATQMAVDMLFRTAHTMPEDKVTWRPLDKGRSALDMLQECAQSAQWAIPLLQGDAMPAYDQELMAKAREQRKQWKTVDECERACRENCEKFYDVLRSYPDDQLEKMIQMPFGPNMVWPATAVMNIHYWNVTYHTGQINYIQTLYGDTEMH